MSDGCNYFVPWPDGWPPHHNACNDPCDMLRGPCACGAWHMLTDWEDWIGSRLRTQRPQNVAADV